MIDLYHALCVRLNNIVYHLCELRNLRGVFGLAHWFRKHLLYGFGTNSPGEYWHCVWAGFGMDDSQHLLNSIQTSFFLLAKKCDCFCEALRRELWLWHNTRACYGMPFSQPWYNLIDVVYICVRSCAHLLKGSWGYMRWYAILRLRYIWSLGRICDSSIARFYIKIWMLYD